VTVPGILSSVFKDHRLLYHSTLGLRVIQNKKKIVEWEPRASTSSFGFRSGPLIPAQRNIQLLLKLTDVPLFL